MPTSVEQMPAGVAPGTDDEVIRTDELTKVYPGDILAVDGLDLSVQARRDLRPARSERRRQDDDRRDAHDARHPDRRTRVRRRRRRRRAPDRGEAGDRRRAADEHARPVAHRLGEPLLPRSLLRHEREDVEGRGRPGCSSSSASPTAPTRRCSRSPAGWRSGSWWPGRSCTGPRSCSSTSPPPASIRRAASRCGTSSASSTRDGQTILLTTHYMEEADELCDRLAIIDHGQLLALDTPSALKQSVGIDAMVTVTADGDLDQLAAVLRDEIADRDHGRARRTTSCGWACSQIHGRAARDRRRGRAAGLHRHRPLVDRTDARDRLHQPHREGPPRMTTITTPDDAPGRQGRSSAPRAGRPAPRSRRCSCATSPCCASR